MPTLYHPDLDRTHDFPSDRAANVARRSGWTDPPGDQPEEQHEDPQPGGLSHEGDEVPEVPDNEREDEQ